MGRRSYDQHCPLALALDRVGDRWTLLIVRELLLGPRRYTDLLEGLPGIGTNLLAERLKRLEADGIVRRVELPPPARAGAWGLTRRGRGLEPALLALGRWGLAGFGPPRPDDSFNPRWLPLSMRLMFRPERARGISEAYQFEVEGIVFHARVDDGRLEVGDGPAADAAVTVRTDVTTLFELGAGGLDPVAAAEEGRAAIEGDPEALRRAARILGPPAAPLKER